MGWLDNPKNRERARLEYEAHKRAGKLIDLQDELIERKEAIELLVNKEGITHLLRGNHEWCDVEWFIKNLDEQIADLEKQIHTELDKLPKMKVTTKRYKIVDDEPKCPCGDPCV